MTPKTIHESGMTFGPFNSGAYFHIEKSQLYDQIQTNVKMAEFLLLRSGKNGTDSVWIIEAKSSTPHPGNHQNLDVFIATVHDKFLNAFSLTLAALLGRHPDALDELPAVFRSLNLSCARFKFILVIKGHKTEWLPPLKDALARSLKTTIKTWGIIEPAVAVMNDCIAQDTTLIC